MKKKTNLLKNEKKIRNVLTHMYEENKLHNMILYNIIHWSGLYIYGYRTSKTTIHSVLFTRKSPLPGSTDFE
jgi:hypothetical protein